MARARTEDNGTTEGVEYRSLNFKVEQSEYDLVRQMATLEGKNMSTFVHDAVAEYVKGLAADPGFKQRVRDRLEAQRSQLESLAG